jgi:hypothetical protein
VRGGTKGGAPVSKLKIHLIVLALVVLFGSAKLANAQSGDIYFNLGTATAKSTGQSIDTFGDGNFLPTPSMGGVFGGFGGSYMIKPTLGVGFEYFSRFAQADYAGLNYRPRFYDFNAIWMPISNSNKVVPEFQAGVGAAHISFYYNQQFCDIFAGCSTSNTFLESSNHFQTHLGAGVKIYVKGGIFVRPQLDIHYVRNFFQFGSNWSPAYSVALGYTFGRQ